LDKGVARQFGFFPGGKDKGARTMQNLLDPVGVAATTARAAAAALMARTFRGVILALHNVTTAAADKVAATYGEEDPIYLVNRDIAAVTERVLEELESTSHAADSSFLEELHEAANFTADATHTFVGTNRLRRVAQQARAFAEDGFRNVGDAAARVAETAGLDRDSLAAAQENVRRRRNRPRQNTCCGRCRRSMRSCCFRWRMWFRRTCACC
jgi:hypothetical protein